MFNFGFPGSTKTKIDPSIKPYKTILKRDVVPVYILNDWQYKRLNIPLRKGFHVDFVPMN